MSKFEVVFSTDNAAFSELNDGGAGYEIVRILRDIADRIEFEGLQLNSPGRIRDFNGNRVGFFNYSYNEENK